MQIIIVGCGKVGRTLAEQLQEEDTDITLIDINPDRINEIIDEVDAMGVVGNGDGLTRRGVDCGFIGNGQRQVVRQDNFQRLSFHGGGPVRYHLACLGVHHLNGSGVHNQGFAQLVH